MSTSTSTTTAANLTALLRIQRDPAFPSAQLPTRGSAAAAGYDLYAAADVLLPAKNGRKVVPTGIKVAVPEGCYGRVAPRSGLASKHGIDVGAGVIDADYRGLLGVLLFNFGDADFQIKAGDRIAQLVLEQIRTPDVVEVEDLEETDRGAAGFGSTGGFGIVEDGKVVAAATTNGAAPSSPKKRRIEEAGEGRGPLETLDNGASA
ncbi:hypothetical protein CF326_g9287 [Tilletia indica]|nr:hypothetical protein CF326_g9287 [Tilletia indica]